MEKGLLLKGQLRDKAGTKQSAKLRKQGRIPAIVYGHKKEPLAISLDKHEFVEGIHHGHRLVEIQLGDEKETMLVKEVQYDHLGREVIHADLVRVSATETIEVKVPIEVKGIAKGAQDGGVIAIHTDQLEVECLVTAIPESIAVSVKELAVGDTIYAKDVKLPEGVKLVSDSETLLISCNVIAEVKTTEEVELEAPATPEIITEKKVEEEPQGEKKSE